MAHISVAAAKRASRKPAGLTVVKATREARRIVDATMPGVGATVDSRLSALTDGSLTPVIVTTITFSDNERSAVLLADALDEAFSPLTTIVNSSRVVITRKVN